MNRTSSIPTAPSRRGFLAVAAAGAASAVAPAALATPLAPVTETVPSSLLPAAAASSEVDPIFAVIAEHRAIMRAWMDAFTMEDMAEHGTPERKAAEDLIDELCHRESDMIRVVLTTQPTTIAGIAALLNHVGQDEFLGMQSLNGDIPRTILTEWNDQEEDGRRQIAQAFPLRLAATVRTMAGTATIRPIEPSEPDPIYAAIKAEREAYAAYLATGEAESRINDQCPDRIVVKPGGVPRKRRKTAAVKAWWAEYQKAEAVHQKCLTEFFAARSTFLQTQPSTVAGLRAFVDHIDGPFSHGHGCEAFWDEHEMEMACPTLTAAVRSLVVRS
jgi:hypothetical protein